MTNLKSAYLFLETTFVQIVLYTHGEYLGANLSEIYMFFGLPTSMV